MKILNICLFLALSNAFIVAQTGTIRGVISDNNGQAVPFANIILVEKNVGKASTSLRGIEATEGGIFLKMCLWERIL